MKIKFRYVSQKNCNKEGCPVQRRDIIELDTSGNDQYRFMRSPRAEIIPLLKELYPSADELVEQTFAQCLLCTSHVAVERISGEALR